MSSRFRFSTARRPILAALGLLVVLAWLTGNPTDLHGQSQAEDAPKMLRHVVLLQFKDSSSDADVGKIVDAFRELPSKISQIADFEYGVNNSPEGLSDGLTHCFLVSFKSEADRDAYLPHPAHQAFVEVLRPHLEKATVVDYWAER